MDIQGSKASGTKLTVKQLALTGLMTAVLCVIGPWALNLPISPVPISLGTLGIYFVVTVMGLKLGTLSVLLYILLGLAGLPVFVNFTAGPGKLLGPTGGYIIGYLFLAPICGIFAERFPKSIVLSLAGILLGTAVLYLFGTLWLQYQLNLTFLQALWAGVIPYIPGDIAKAVIAVLLGAQTKKRLIKAGALS